MLAVIGIGPGEPTWRTPEASAALAQATDIVGYGLYLDLLGRAIDSKSRHASKLSEEAARVRLALDLAAEGRSVARARSRLARVRAARPRGETGVAKRRARSLSRYLGDAGRRCVGRGAARSRFLRDLPLRPVDAVGDDPREAGSRGSDRLCRCPLQPALDAAAGRLAEAAAILLRHRSLQTPVFVARNLGHDGEEQHILALAELASAELDMLSIVLIGSRTTRRLDTDRPRLYAPRGYLDRDHR
jgi:cobalt-precorrin 5A hydrolase/precorrin-3B C17-methyltransferase